MTGGYLFARGIRQIRWIWIRRCRRTPERGSRRRRGRRQRLRPVVDVAAFSWLPGSTDGTSVTRAPRRTRGRPLLLLSVSQMSVRRRWMRGVSGELRTRVAWSIHCREGSCTGTVRCAGERANGSDQNPRRRWLTLVGSELARLRQQGTPASDWSGLAARLIRGEEGKWRGA